MHRHQREQQQQRPGAALEAGGRGACADGVAGGGRERRPRQVRQGEEDLGGVERARELRLWRSGFGWRCR